MTDAFDPSIDYFEVLNLTSDATDSEIKNSFKYLAKQFHPDRNVGDITASEKFKKIAKAYYVLSHPLVRMEYLLARDSPTHNSEAIAEDDENIQVKSLNLNTSDDLSNSQSSSSDDDDDNDEIQSSYICIRCGSIVNVPTSFFQDAGDKVEIDCANCSCSFLVSNQNKKS